MSQSSSHNNDTSTNTKLHYINSVFNGSKWISYYATVNGELWVGIGLTPKDDIIEKRKVNDCRTPEEAVHLAVQVLNQHRKQFSEDTLPSNLNKNKIGDIIKKCEQTKETHKGTELYIKEQPASFHAVKRAHEHFTFVFQN